jgi:hypothetical protein
MVSAFLRYGCSCFKKGIAGNKGWVKGAVVGFLPEKNIRPRPLKLRPLKLFKCPLVGGCEEVKPLQLALNQWVLAKGDCESGKDKDNQAEQIGKKRSPIAGLK